MHVNRVVFGSEQHTDMEHQLEQALDKCASLISYRYLHSADRGSIVIDQVFNYPIFEPTHGAFAMEEILSEDILCPRKPRDPKTDPPIFLKKSHPKRTK